MAENKRNSMSAKIATPKVPLSPSSNDTLQTLASAVGGRIKITASPASQQLEGTLFTVCPILNVIALNTKAQQGAGSVQAGDYHIIPVSRVQNVQILSTLSAAERENMIKNGHTLAGMIDHKRDQDRANARIRQLKEQEENRGKGVTKEAQAIFDALKRVNIPIRWHDQQMIVHEAVIISPPYRPEDCRGSKDKQQVVGQVKKVLEGERRKLKEREDKERVATPPIGQRKGG